MHPLQERFVPTLDQLKAIGAYMEINRLDSVSVSPRIPIAQKLRRIIFPRIVESYPEVPDLIYEQNVTFEQALQFSQHPKAIQSHFTPRHEEWCKRLTEMTRATIPPNISDSFDGPAYVPWDTGIRLGPWKVHDHNNGKVIARGRFAITRSGNSYPKNLETYLAAFKSLEPIAGWKAFLELTCSTPWTMTIYMS